MNFIENHWGDVASVLGCALSILTIWFARRAKKAAEQVRDQLSRFDTITELSAAIMVIEQIIWLQRAEVWDFVLNRHVTLQLHLVRSQEGIENEALQFHVGAAIAQSKIMMEKIERAKTKAQRSKLNIAAFNRALSDQIGALEKVRIDVKKAGI